jgi:glycosyltransferase involved in cell wall biosynthesis
LELSVVVPVYGCRDCLPELHERLTRQLEAISSDYELILVDDRSPDDSWTVLKALAESDPHVKAIRLSRNFGQHNAITAGLAASQGEWTVVMDCDLQDPPEEISTLYDAARHGGFDLVLARRAARSHSWIRLMLSRIYFKLLNTFMGTKIDGSYGTFSILSRKVVSAYLTLGDRDRHYLFVLQWLGFEQGSIRFQQAARAGGGSSAYTLSRLIRHAVRGVFFQTTNVLLYIVYFGFFLAGGGILLAVFLLYLVAVAHPPPGYTSVMVVMIIVSGFIIVSTGVTGLYIGRVFEQVKGRPLYVVDEIAHKSRSGARTKPERREVESVH